VRASEINEILLTTVVTSSELVTALSANLPLILFAKMYKPEPIYNLRRT
jgi:hypothetical protein